jgi:ferredoxin-NADP reductase
VLIEGPYGRLTGAERIGSKVTMLACGIGITPMRALLEDLSYAPGDAVLIYRARHDADLVFRHDLDRLAEQRGIAVHYLVGPRIPGRRSWLPRTAAKWSDAAALRRLAPQLLASDVFVCGPDAWMDAACAAALDAGVPPERLHQERFTW